uniref:Sulfotransferase family-containing protein n=1 Tax=Strongyloides venezuelensis TaxID=75913 RepID=A0A0K0FAP9_STRVS
MKNKISKLTFILYLLLNVFPTSSINKTIKRYSIDCENSLNGKKCVEGFQNVTTYYRINSRYKLNFCTIQKNLSTVLKAISCYLDHPKLQKEKHQLVSNFWISNVCKSRNKIDSLKKEAIKFSDGNIINFLTEYKSIVIVRNPIERFISAFTDKCVLRYTESIGRCYGCFEDLSCFINTLYKRLLKQVNNPKKVYRATYVDRHFYPQSWYCQLNNYHNMYKVFKINPENKQSVKKFYKNLSEYLLSQGVSSREVNFIEKEGMKKYTGHTTFHTKKRKIIKKELLENAKLMDKLMRIYYYDFKIFNFKLPKKSTRFYI